MFFPLDVSPLDVEASALRLAGARGTRIETHSTGRGYLIDIAWILSIHILPEERVRGRFTWMRIILPGKRRAPATVGYSVSYL